MNLRVMVEIDGLALPSVANLREHWSDKAKRTKYHRGLAWARVSPALLHHAVALRSALAGDGLTVRITRVAPRALDDDNLASACKSVRDGITDALRAFGVSDDRDARVRWQYAQARGVQPRHYAVRVEVTT